MTTPDLGLRLRGRVPTAEALPAVVVPLDVWAITDGRRYAIGDPWGHWVLGDWDAPQMAGDYFGIALDDVPTAGA